MGLSKVLMCLGERGINVASRMFKGKTLISFDLGGKKLVQLFDKSGNLSKFKIYQNNGVFGSRTITKGSRLVDPELGVTTTTKLTRTPEYPFLKPDKTVVKNMEIVPGERYTTVQKTTTGYDETTKISSSRMYDGSHTGIIEREINGVKSPTREFDTGRFKNEFDPLSPYDDFSRINQYEDDYSRMLRQMEEDNQRILEEQRRNDDDLLTMFGLGFLGGL